MISGFKVFRKDSVLFWGLWNSVKTFHSSRVSKVNDFDALLCVSAIFGNDIYDDDLERFWKCISMILK